jgi:serine protease Do
LSLARRLLLSAAVLFPVQVSWAQAPAARDVPDLSRLSRDLRALGDRVTPAVVQIMAAGYTATEGALVRGRSSGSGVIVDPAGYVVTNAHVVQGARRLQVALSGGGSGPTEARSVLKPAGRVVAASVIGIDRETDLAVLKIGEAGLPFLPLGDSEALRPGELVLAFGSPLGLENSVTLGVVSGVARQVKPDGRMIYIQTDAAINPGNSGGPLVDAEGRVVGINTMILSQSGGSEGIGFAAPSNIVRNVFEQIKKTGRVHRGEIGVRAQTITPALATGLGLRQDWGVVLSDVRPGGPAAQAGLRISDVVLSLDGKVMENARQFDVNLYSRAPGARVNVGVLRGQERTTFAVTVAERAGDPERFADRVSQERNAVERLGILGLDLDESLAALVPSLRARAGVIVASVDQRGAAGLESGDVIYTANQESVTSVERLRAALAQVGAAAPLVLQVERDGELRYVVVEPAP